MVCWFTISQNGIVSEGGRTAPSLAQLREACGGYVELITLPSHNHIWVNEDGRLQRLPPNEAATALYWDSGKYMNMFTPELVGDVVMVYTGNDVDYQDCYDHIMQYDTSISFEEWFDYTKVKEEE